MSHRPHARTALTLGAVGAALLFVATPALAMTAAHGPSAHAPCAADDPMAFDDGPTQCTSTSGADPMNLNSNDFLAGPNSTDGMGTSQEFDTPDAPSNADASGNTASLGAASKTSTVNAVASWFESLSNADQESILHNAAHEGLTDDKGRPFTPREFLALSAVMDHELEKKGLDEAQKRQVFDMMEQRAGITGEAH